MATPPAQHPQKNGHNHPAPHQAQPQPSQRPQARTATQNHRPQDQQPTPKQPAPQQSTAQQSSAQSSSAQPATAQPPTHHSAMPQPAPPTPRQQQESRDAQDGRDAQGNGDAPGSLGAQDRPGLPGQQRDEPRQRQDASNRRQDAPGQQQDGPGQCQDAPGQQRDGQEQRGADSQRIPSKGAEQRAVEPQAAESREAELRVVGAQAVELQVVEPRAGESQAVESQAGESQGSGVSGAGDSAAGVSGGGAAGGSGEKRVGRPAHAAAESRTADDVEAGIIALWHTYGQSREQGLRDRLVLHYAPLVKYVAGRVGTGLPAHVDVADLIQSGIFGLVDAIEKFEPERGLKFETYAMQRIRGAILDDLRSQDWVPRSVRSRARDVERALERLGGRLQRTPTDRELAAELKIGLGELRELYAQFQLTSVVALDELIAAGRAAGSAGSSLAESLPDEGAEDPVASLVDQDSRRQLADAIAQLAERDRVVVTLYYFENLTLAEIGKVLGVTESRVCQLHTRAVLRLRTKINEQLET
ncbi:RNA polymerase sigma factor for flagellar operon [Actinosynnema pretiosum subsp. pretiosum]|nr:RNA polymerase sigma factor for flagellar operon [Actinosynnema pretiosum subsp. pretiosum]